MFAFWPCKSPKIVVGYINGLAGQNIAGVLRVDGQTPENLPIRGKSGFQPGNQYAKNRMSGSARFQDRLRIWWEEKSVAEIESLVKNKRAWNKLKAIDAAIVQRIAQAQRVTGIQDMALLLDRLCGKAMQPLADADGGSLVQPIVDQMEIARRTAFLLAMAAHTDQPAPITLEDQSTSGVALAREALEKE